VARDCHYRHSTLEAGETRLPIHLAKKTLTSFIILKLILSIVKAVKVVKIQQSFFWCVRTSCVVTPNAFFRKLLDVDTVLVYYLNEMLDKTRLLDQQSLLLL